MEFEEMKKVWDAQNNETLYAINEDTLHRRVIQKNTEVKRMASVSEIGIFLICTLMGLVFIIEGVIDNELYQIPEALVFFGIAGYTAWDRRRRIRLQHDFAETHTVLGKLEQAIRVLEHHIRRQRNFIWWYLVPVSLTSFSHFVFTAGQKPWWLIPMVCFAYALGCWVVDRELRKRVLPKQKNLEALKQLISEAN